MLNELAAEIHQNNVDKGFWGVEMTLDREDGPVQGEWLKSLRSAYTSQRIALMHSELSEALEADRKDLMDDKLPQFKGLDVEIVDCLIRALDFLGHRKVDIDEILQAKLEYNKSRPHKHGKAY